MVCAVLNDQETEGDERALLHRLSSQKALLVIRCIRTNERCVDKSQTRELKRDPFFKGPLCGSKRTYRSKARPRQDPIFKVQTTQMGLGYTQCIVTSQRPTRVREVSPDTALISLVASVQDEMEVLREQSRPKSNTCVAS